MCWLVAVPMLARVRMQASRDWYCYQRGHEFQERDEVVRLGGRGRRRSVASVVILTALVGSLLLVAPVRPVSPAAAQTTPEPDIVIPRPGRIAQPGTVTVEGVVTGVETANVDRVVFVVDTSGSTGSSGNDCNGDGTVGPADDLNGNGVDGEVLDCEILAITTLTDQLAAQSAIEVPIVRFASSASTLPIGRSGASFAAPSSADGDGNGVADVVTLPARRSRVGGPTSPLPSARSGTSMMPRPPRASGGSASSSPTASAALRSRPASPGWRARAPSSTPSPSARGRQAAPRATCGPSPTAPAVSARRPPNQSDRRARPGPRTSTSSRSASTVRPSGTRWRSISANRGSNVPV